MAKTGATPFNRRIFTWATFRESLQDVLDHLDDLRAAARSGRVSKAFAEKIMLAVTQVNGCRYCNYGHTRAALKVGVTKEELRHLVQGQFDRLPEDEIIAILFAQHYAEQGGKPDEEAWQRLVETYGPETARDIMAYIRMIMFGNLLGNTFDAFLSRLAGRPAEGSSLFDEIAVLTMTVLLIPLYMVKHVLRRVFRPQEQSSPPALKQAG